MPAFQPLLAILAAAVALVALAAVIAFALARRLRFRGRFRMLGRALGGLRSARQGSTAEREPVPILDVPAPPSIRLLARERRPSTRTDAATLHGLRPRDDELDEVLRGSFAVDTYDRTLRVLASSFILIALLVVSVSQLWPAAQSKIVTTLILAGLFVLVVHELVPLSSLKGARIVIEGSVAIVFLTILVLLTGNSSSPFFFLYPVLVGGAALLASPAITLTLAIETAFAYAVAALSGPQDPAGSRDALARIAINMTALVLLSYSGMVVARVQRRTRDAAIRLSTVDSLTDLYNRAYFFKAVDNEIRRERRFRRGFCLLMMDMDGLKSINDRYGHYQGDVVLRSVAELIRAGLRGIDVAARYGGDEFVALLPETDTTGAYVVAEKIRQMVSQLRVEAGVNRIATSLSIGVVSYPVDGQTADELMIAADEAMYSSKRLGKNRVVGYAEPSEPAQTPAVFNRPQFSTPSFRELPRDGDDRPSGKRGRR
jgi:diguanylate cyclase (GGDEF)-like protein